MFRAYVRATRQFAVQRLPIELFPYVLAVEHDLGLDVSAARWIKRGNGAVLCADTVLKVAVSIRI